MKRQQEMVESFTMAHRDFMNNLDKSFTLLERELHEVADFDARCTGEWCAKMENSIDELAKFIYSISEPRWLPNEDSKIMHHMRHRVHDIYAKFKGVSSRPSH